MQSIVEKARSICANVEREIGDAYPNLQLCYIVHGSSQFREAIALREQDIVRHPASEQAQSILKRSLDQDDSSFLGLAISTKTYFFGLGRKDLYFALININTGQDKDIHAIRQEIYHLSWHAIDLMQVAQNPKYKDQFKNSPMIPKRSPYNLAKANLKADIYASTLQGILETPDSVRKLAERRASQVLSPIKNNRAENYPYIVAMEPTEYIVNDMNLDGISGHHTVLESLKTSHDIAKIVDESGIGIEQWWAFSRSAQDMAWRGYPSDIILGAAINTSEDPYVRAIGYLIADIVGAKPKSALDLMNSYNPFANPQHNEQLHDDLVDSVFEELISATMRNESTDIMILTANQQNENMTSGNLIGWCASGLQASARAFERAKQGGQEPEQAARLEFQGNKTLTTWDAIQSLGQKIVERKRQGYIVTLGHIAELCEDMSEISEVLKSVQDTIQNPAYVQKLQAANELNVIPKAALNGPHIKGPAPVTPALHAAPSAPGLSVPGLGGGSRSNAAMRQRLLQQQRRQSEDSTSSSQ